MDEVIVIDDEDEKLPENILSCPFCPFLVESRDQLSAMQDHVENVHLSPEENLEAQKAADVTSRKELACPVCCSVDFPCIDSLTQHIDEHFNSKTHDVNDDRAIAVELEQEERASMQSKEMQEFKKLQALHGFVDGSSMEKQSNSALFKAVEKGRMSTVEYHEKRILQKISERRGVDDSSSASFGIIPKIRSLSVETPRVKQVFICSNLDHYAASFGDSGWGCGYRNLQMMLSCLLRNSEYAERLKSIDGNSTPDEHKSVQVPSITRLQNAIEEAWKQGFDVEGCKQLDGKLVNTCKWIGATEIATCLLSNRIRCQILDFHRPTSSDGKHPALMSWVLDYYKKPLEMKPPLYFQHQGHSRTIVGVEQLQNSQLQLLVLDPSHTSLQMNQLYSQTDCKIGLKRIRCSLASLKQKQYQIVSVDGLLDEQEFAESKVLRSTRIPGS